MQHKSAIVTFVEKPQLIRIDFQVEIYLLLYLRFTGHSCESDIAS